MPFFYCTTVSPIGVLTIIANDSGLHSIVFPKDERLPGLDHYQHKDDHPLLRQARMQLEQYFTKQRREFDLPLTIHGTEFQRTVWNALTTIPYGRTISYAELAARIGHSRAVRAVGAANGRNPLPIVLPCHRVIGSDGSLTGFAGGLPTKQYLLRLENALPEGAATLELAFPF
ncbi:MAG: methylated-DNA--[protein]-cysteine S-methyltransferase [Xanthomonadaceae bacterium]|jgi:methylated-DNA-[protein]-cysteine S-methyltransferase|nr:methylated-DNA--[protein]-cysteine S-methyltransferase [Xanthomonadaceae bacterium]